MAVDAPVRELQLWFILSKGVALTGQLVPTSLQHQDKTRDGLTDTNTGISCKLDIKRRHILGKKENETLKTAITESLELTTSLRIS